MRESEKDAGRAIAVTVEVVSDAGCPYGKRALAIRAGHALVVA